MERSGEKAGEMPSSPGISVTATDLTAADEMDDDGGGGGGWKFEGGVLVRRSAASACGGSGSEREWNDESPPAQSETRRKAERIRLPSPTSIEGLRYQSDLRQIGAILLVLGIGAYVSSLMLQAELAEGGMADKSVEGVKLAQLTATTLQTLMGLFASGVGFVALTVTPTGGLFHITAKWLVFVINAAGPIGLIITIVRVVQGARVPPEQNQFIPMSFDPTETDIHFVAAMGVLGISSVCSSLIGGLTVVSLNICAYLGGRPVDKNRGYYIVRFGYYNVIVFIGGVSQLALGIYLLLRYGGGFYDEPIRVTVYAVTCPEMAIAAGAVQTIVPIYGFFRATGWVSRGSPDDPKFLWASGVLWIVTTVFQIMVQPAYVSGGRGQYTAEGATYSAVYLGTFVMPPYLDYLVRNTAIRVRPEDFGLSPELKERVDPLARCFGLTSERMLNKKKQQRLDSEKGALDSVALA